MSMQRDGKLTLRALLMRSCKSRLMLSAIKYLPFSKRNLFTRIGIKKRTTNHELYFASKTEKPEPLIDSFPFLEWNALIQIQ